MTNLEQYQKRFTNYLKRVNISESTASLILGILVVLILAVLAYNFFKVRPSVNQPTTPGTTTEEQNENNPSTTSGQLTAPTAAVSLPTTHTVAAGETLWSIAEKYYNSGFNWVDIARVNGITDPAKITVGQKLTIPNVQVRQPSTGTATITPVITVNRIEGNSYTVVRGDNLWDISVRAYGDGFQWTKIAQANHLANPRLIHAGNVFTIPR